MKGNAIECVDCDVVHFVGEVTERDYPNCPDCEEGAVEPLLVLEKDETVPNLANLEDFWHWGREQYEIPLDLLRATA